MTKDKELNLLEDTKFEKTSESEKEKVKVKIPIITKIQNELKAPKNQYNNFGRYKYRNAEDIEMAVKPLLAKYGATLTFDEDVKEVGDRIYFVEIARYEDSEQKIQVKGWARESLNKKGMDDSQISGAASSYATKYALAKLFLIDDSKDADNAQPTNKRSTTVRETQAQRIAKAKAFEVQYGGGKEKLVDIYNWEKKGDSQAKLFLDGWRKKSSGNEKAYKFIKKLEG